MKALVKVFIIIFITVVPVTFFYSCRKKPTPPIVTTANVTAITQTSASSGGNVTSDGGAGVTSRGVCWGTSPIPRLRTIKLQMAPV